MSVFASHPAIFGRLLAEAPREHLEQAKETVLDHLETAIVDQNGRRFKEREIAAAMKTVARL